MTELILDALAVFRLWRLAAKDDLTEPIRSRWETFVWDRAKVRAEPGHAPPVPKLVVLVGCPWCLGFWLTCFVFVVRRHRRWPPVRDALAVSALVGVVAEAESKLHD